MSNPNPYRISNPMWRLWTDRPDSTWKLSGIYANKRYYHSSVNQNLVNWPDNYSVRYTLDLKPPDSYLKKFARAIDYTMSDSKMVKYTRRLIIAADDNDPRMKPVREFYGTVDNRNVIGRIRNDDRSGYRSSSSDNSHLWHIHISVWCTYVDNWSALSGILSILRGEELSRWKERVMSIIELRASDRNYEANRFLQRRLAKLGFYRGDIDGKWGPITTDAVIASRRAFGYQNNGAMSDVKITGWHAEDLDEAIATKEAKAVAGVIDTGEVVDKVLAYIENNKEEFRGEPPTAAQILTAFENWWKTSNTVEEATRRIAESWLESNKEDLRGPEGPTPSVITIEAQVKS